MEESDVKPSRERKSVERYAPAPEKVEKEFISEKGKGIQLAEYDYFVQKLDRHHGDSDIVKSLHSLLYNQVGKKHETKKHIRMFSGFGQGVNTKEKLDKVLENKKKWNVRLLKDSLELFGLERSGTRDELASRLVDYLNKPSLIKKAPRASTSSKRSRTSTSSTKSTPTKKDTKKRKRKAKKDSNTNKKKRAPSAYILYATAKREEIKQENPEASFTDLMKIAGTQWNNLSDIDKQEWIDKAAEAKKALAESEHGEVEETAEQPEEDDEEEGEDNDEEDEEEDNEEEDAEQEEDEKEDKEEEEVTEDDAGYMQDDEKNGGDVTNNDNNDNDNDNGDKVNNNDNE